MSKFMESNMKSESSSIVRTVNTLMMWLFCLTVLMLVMPWEYVSQDFATQIHNNKIFIYFALIIELSNLISQVVLTFFNSYNYKNQTKRLQALVEKTVAQLDFAEKALLREYVLQRKSVLALPVTEPTVRNLIDGGVLKIVSIVDEANRIAQVIISKEARPHITYKSIGLTLGKMSEEQISAIMNARPEFAKEKYVNNNRVFIGSRAVNSLFKSPAADDMATGSNAKTDNSNAAA